MTSPTSWHSATRPPLPDPPHDRHMRHGAEIGSHTQPEAPLQQGQGELPRADGEERAPPTSLPDPDPHRSLRPAEFPQVLPPPAEKHPHGHQISPPGVFPRANGRHSRMHLHPARLGSARDPQGWAAPPNARDSARQQYLWIPPRALRPGRPYPRDRLFPGSFPDRELGTHHDPLLPLGRPRQKRPPSRPDDQPPTPCVLPHAPSCIPHRNPNLPPVSPCVLSVSTIPPRRTGVTGNAHQDWYTLDMIYDGQIYRPPCEAHSPVSYTHLTLPT